MLYISPLLIKVILFVVKIGPNLGNNRRRKAFERTWTWFDKIHNYLAQHEELKSSQLYGVVFADSGHDAQLVKMTQAMLQKGVKGNGVLSQSFSCVKDSHKIITFIWRQVSS